MVIMVTSEKIQTQKNCRRQTPLIKKKISFRDIYSRPARLDLHGSGIMG